MRDPVALLLADQDVAREVARLRVVPEHLIEQVRRRGRGSSAASSKRSKNSRSRGAKIVASRAMARHYRRATPPDEGLELLGIDRVDVLRPREAARAHVVGVGRDSGDHVGLQMGVALGEAGAHPVVDPEQVVEHQNLAVGVGAGADPDHGDLHARGQRGGHGGGDRLEDDREAAGLLQRERVRGDGQRPLAGAALGLVAAERGGGLRGQADVAHDRDPGGDDRPGAVDHRAAALELDGGGAALLDEPLRGGHGLLVGRLVGAEGQVGDEERRLEPAAGGRTQHEQLVDETGTVES